MSIGVPLRQEFSNFHPNGEIAIDPATAVLVALPTANVFVAVTNWGLEKSSPEGRLTADESTGELAVEEKGFGIYQIQNNCSIFSDINNVVCNASVFKNGVRQSPLSWTEEISKKNQVTNVSFAQVLQLSTGDVIDFRMATDSTSVNITLVDGALSAFWLSGE